MRICILRGAPPTSPTPQAGDCYSARAVVEVALFKDMVFHDVGTYIQWDYAGDRPRSGSHRSQQPAGFPGGLRGGPGHYCAPWAVLDIRFRPSSSACHARPSRGPRRDRRRLRSIGRATVTSCPGPVLEKGWRWMPRAVRWSLPVPSSVPGSAGRLLRCRGESAGGRVAASAVRQLAVWSAARFRKPGRPR